MGNHWYLGVRVDGLRLASSYCLKHWHLISWSGKVFLGNVLRCSLSVAEQPLHPPLMRPLGSLKGILWSGLLRVRGRDKGERRWYRQG